MYLAAPFRKLVCVLFVGTFLLASGSIAFAGEVVDTIERSFTVSGRPTLFLRNGDGRTRVVSDSQSQVRVKAIKEVRRAGSREEAQRVAEQVQVRIEQIGSRIEIEARYPRHIGNLFGTEPEVLVHFEVTAPKSSDIDARSSDGSLDVYGFDGRIDVTTGDGNLTADNCSGRITAQTGDGSLQIESSRGEVSAHSGDGKIILDGVFQGLEAKSGDGRIEITARAGSRMDRDWSIRSGRWQREADPAGRFRGYPGRQHKRRPDRQRALGDYGRIVVEESPHGKAQQWRLPASNPDRRRKHQHPQILIRLCRIRTKQADLCRRVNDPSAPGMPYLCAVVVPRRNNSPVG